MKRNILFVIIMFSSSVLFSQNIIFTSSNKQLNNIAVIKNSPGWVDFKQTLTIDPEGVFVIYKKAFLLTDNDAMVVNRVETDWLGYNHYRYEQYYKGLRVEGSKYIVHSKDNISVSGNGMIINGLDIEVDPRVKADEAFQRAVDFVSAEKYMWENPINEERIKYITGKQSASYYPVPELLIFDKRFSGIANNYRLAWKISVYAEKPLSFRDIYIDAVTGSVIHVVNRLHNTDVPGIATTAYSGSQNIITDSIAPGQYRLREASRGNGVETYDMNTGTNYGAAVDFTDSDNIWNNINAQQDEIATDAHWGAEMTYDYYLIMHGRHSFDNADAKLVSYVHYDQDYANAFWDGTCMTYGDGDGSSTGPFTSLDVCGHEITHGVTQYSADLIYQDESGALNEAFSDIFSAAIENYALAGAGDWFVGEDFDLQGGNGFRNMSDPKSDQQPDTYLGQYWYSGLIDNGGVHTNSGVANYWFYLLSDGGTGVNDNNMSYDVTGISIDSAALIAYRALTVYLTSTSQHADMRQATLQSAIDIFGECSQEYVQCANAWYAVGVGTAISDFDFSMELITSPVTACGLTDEILTVNAVYNGCNQDALPGDTVLFSYSLDGSAVVTDTVILVSAVQGGDTLSYSFLNLLDVSVIGYHNITTWITYMNDSIHYNDTIANYIFENREYQNVDVGVTSVNAPYSSCFLSDSEQIEIEFEFFGCDYLAAGDSVKLGYSINSGAPVYETVVLATDLYPGTALTYIFNTTADLSVSGDYEIDAWTEYYADTLFLNDQYSGYQIKKPKFFNDNDSIVTFEETDIDDRFLSRTTIYSNAYVSTAAQHTGGKGFLMTGGNPFEYISMIELPDGNNTWQLNDFLSAKIDFCVDASAWSEAYLSFDLKQTFGDLAYTMILGPADYSITSNLRVLVNDSVMIGNTYNPVSGSADPFTTYVVDLSTYTGSEFMLTFETRNLSKDTLGFKMDNAYVDNVKMSKVSNLAENIQPQNRGIQVYPNPCDGKFRVSGDFEGSSLISVYDYTGNLVFEKTIAESLLIDIDLGDKAKGFYFLKIENNDNIFRSGVLCW